MNEDIQFTKVYNDTISPNLDVVKKVWSRQGGRWIQWLTGSTCHDYLDVGTRMDDYMTWEELSGEEQYAFFMWAKREKLLGKKVVLIKKTKGEKINE